MVSVPSYDKFVMSNGTMNPIFGFRIWQTPLFWPRGAWTHSRSHHVGMWPFCNQVIHSKLREALNELHAHRVFPQPFPPSGMDTAWCACFGMCSLIVNGVIWTATILIHNEEHCMICIFCVLPFGRWFYVVSVPFRSHSIRAPEDVCSHVCFLLVDQVFLDRNHFHPTPKILHRMHAFMCVSCSSMTSFWLETILAHKNTLCSRSLLACVMPHYRWWHNGPQLFCLCRRDFTVYIFFTIRDVLSHPPGAWCQALDEGLVVNLTSAYNLITALCVFAVTRLIFSLSVGNEWDTFAFFGKSNAWGFGQNL